MLNSLLFPSILHFEGAIEAITSTFARQGGKERNQKLRSTKKNDLANLKQTKIERNERTCVKTHKVHNNIDGRNGKRGQKED